MTEEWRDIRGYEGRYQVSSLGRVRSLTRPGCKGRVLRPTPNGHGYLAVSLSSPSGRGSKNVHRLVAVAFLGPRPHGMEVCHGPGGQHDNRLSNLRYDTPTGNAADRLAAGTYRRGGEHHSAKLTEEQVREIRATPDIPGTEWARRLGIPQPTISAARTGRTWRHL